MSDDQDRQVFILGSELFDEVSLRMSDRGRKLAALVAPELVNSKTSIKEGFAALTESPLQTVFVYDAGTGKILYTLSQNEKYVARCRKKPRPPQPDCCVNCLTAGGICVVSAELGCTCVGAIDGPDLDEPLRVLSP